MISHLLRVLGEVCLGPALQPAFTGAQAGLHPRVLGAGAFERDWQINMTFQFFERDSLPEFEGLIPFELASACKTSTVLRSELLAPEMQIHFAPKESIV
jgi:hypothetical protein